jgi:hypothetical protein
MWQALPGHAMAMVCTGSRGKGVAAGNEPALLGVPGSRLASLRCRLINRNANSSGYVVAGEPDGDLLAVLQDARSLLARPDKPTGPPTSRLLRCLCSYSLNDDSSARMPQVVDGSLRTASNARGLSGNRVRLP